MRQTAFGARTARGLGNLAIFSLVVAPAAAQGALTGLTRVASGLTRPIFATYAPGDYSRLFILERGPNESTSGTGSIKILNLQTGTVLPTPFLSIPGLDTRGEGGALGLAFHPDYATNGKFYTYVTAADSLPNTDFSSYIREYTVSADPNVAGTSFNTLLSWGQPQQNHNGGWMGFSPNDGYLYIASGDGGNGNDQGTGHTEPGGNAQDITNQRLGKMLRIDVNSDEFPGDAARNYAIPHGANRNPFAKVDPLDENEVDPNGDDEIWAYGLRNPFRDSFDRATGDLWIGDVGQGTNDPNVGGREEIDFQASNSPGGENYGWRLREGFGQTPSVGGAKPPGAVDPVYDYFHSGNSSSNANFQGNAVTGGTVYRGPDPSLQGRYFFGDSSSGRIWSFDPANPSGTVVRHTLAANTGSPSTPVAFGEDAAGNLYYVSHFTGEVYRYTTNEFRPGDFDANAAVDGADLLRLMANLGTPLGATRAMGDADGDGDVDEHDLQLLEDNFGWSALDVGATPVSGSVPEPGACMLGLIALAAFRKLRR